MPLSTPVDRRNRKSAIAQIAHGLEIFFDVLAAPLEDAHGAFPIGRRRPARKTDLGAVRSLDRSGNGILGNRVGGNRNERHRTGSVGKNAAKSKGTRVEQRPNALL